MGKIQNKALEMGGETVEEYFFPDIDGHQVTVYAKSREEAEKLAKEKISKLTQ